MSITTSKAVPTQCKSWREFGMLVKITPPQFEINATKVWQPLIDLAIEKLSHSAIVDDQSYHNDNKGNPTFPEDVSDATKHLAYETAKQLIDKSTKEERKVHIGIVKTWKEFEIFFADQAFEGKCYDIQLLYEEYKAARSNMYADIGVLFENHMPYHLKCQGPKDTDFDNLDDVEWMEDISMDYHSSGRSAEEKQEQDYNDQMEYHYRNGGGDSEPEPEGC